jgi:hypothetical protein
MRTMRSQKAKAEQIGSRVRERRDDHREPDWLGSREKPTQDFYKQTEGKEDQKNAGQVCGTCLGNDRAADRIETDRINSGVPQIVECGTEQARGIRKHANGTGYQDLREVNPEYPPQSAPFLGIASIKTYLCFFVTRHGSCLALCRRVTLARARHLLTQA